MNQTGVYGTASPRQAVRKGVIRDSFIARHAIHPPCPVWRVAPIDGRPPRLRNMTAAPPAAPPAFTRAVAALRSVQPRPEIELSEIPPPQRLAPYAFALSGAVVRQDDEVATGRLILLYDPDGHEAWEGTLRLVTYVTAELEPELATDPLLPGVGWSWLTDALEGFG